MNNVFVVPAQFTRQWFKSRRNIVIVVLTLAFILGGVVTLLPASRGAGAAGSASISISPTSGGYSNRDDQIPITVEGSQYAANETINVYWNYTGPNTGRLVASTTADENGAFTVAFLRQLAAAGTYTIAAVGQTSGFVATGKFTQYPLFYEHPQAGAPGTKTIAYGNAYEAHEKVDVYWDYKHPGTRKLLATATSNSTGSFTVQVTIPATATPGIYFMAGIGETSKYLDTYQYLIYSPTLALAPLQGSSGIPLTVSAYGFVGFETVNIYWRNAPTPILAVPTNGYGYVKPTTITVPASTVPGSYPVTLIGKTSHITVTNEYTVVVPGFSLSETSGPVGEKIKLDGQGFATGETVNVFWTASGGSGTKLASAVAGYSGDVHCAFPVPHTSKGTYTLTAIGASSNTTIQHTFTIANGIAASPSSNEPGQTIAVNGTGFQAKETVNVYWDTTSSTPVTNVIASLDGNMQALFPISTKLVPGTHEIIAVGKVSGRSFTTSEIINTNWGDFGFDTNHHRENLAEYTVGTANVDQLKLQWEVTTATGLRASPVYSKGLVYLPTMDGHLNAYNATTGTLQWQFTCNGPFRNFSSALADPLNNMVFFGTVGYYDDGIPSPFYALNAQTGKLEWSVILNWQQAGFPTLALNTLYVQTSHLYHPNNSVYAIDELTGHIQWQYMTNAGVWGAVAVDPNIHLAFTGIGDPEDAIAAIDTKTGTAIWQTTIPHFTADDDVGSGISIANGTIFADSKNGYEYALNEGTGAIVWSTLVGTPGIGNISTQAVSAQGILYVGSLDNDFYAISISNGAILWKVHTKAHIFSSPAIANGVVYFSSFDSNIYAVDANTGAVLWTYNTGLSSYCSPVVVNGWLYCGSTNGNFYAFSL